MAMTIRQRTVAEPSIRFSGIGLHSGKLIAMRLLPAQEDEGIVFVRTDMEPHGRVCAKACNVTDTQLATTLQEGEARIGTVEHLLSALCACGVDNVVVELNGPEVPIMDGSAQPFVTLLRDCGLVEQGAAKQFYRIRREVQVSTDEGQRRASLLPAERPCWELRVDFVETVISSTPQRLMFEFTGQQAYVMHIARARTFGFVRDLNLLRENHRALGGSLSNAVVLTDDRVLNVEGLRQPDEFVAHKLLDAMGDCFINGRLILGRYVGELPGHELNNRLMRALLDDSDAYELVSLSSGVPDFGALQAEPLAAPLPS